MKIKELREQLGLSQVQLAKELNISPSTLCNWEIGRREPDAERIKQLAKYFKVTTDYLLSYNESTYQELHYQTKDHHIETFQERMYDNMNDTISSLLSLCRYFNLISPAELSEGMNHFPTACNLIKRALNTVKKHEPDLMPTEKALQFYELCSEDVIEYLSQTIERMDFLELAFNSGNMDKYHSFEDDLDFSEPDEA